MSNMINTLQQDITGDSTGNLNNLWLQFLNSISNEIYNVMNLASTSSSVFNLFSQQWIYQVLQNELSMWVYQYDSLTLLTWWNNNYMLLASEVGVPLSIFIANWYNNNQVVLNQNITNFVINNNLGNMTVNSANNYDVNSALNNNSQLTMSEINSNGAGAQSLQQGNGNYNTYLGWGKQWTVPVMSTSSASLQNMSADTTPIKDSHGSFQGSNSTTVEGVQIANFMMESYKYLTTTLRKIIFDVFKRFVTPVNNIDNNVEGFNW